MASFLAYHDFCSYHENWYIYHMYGESAWLVAKGKCNALIICLIVGSTTLSRISDGGSTYLDRRYDLRVKGQGQIDMYF